jgi:NhaA family Na+:H+ antiporter
MGPPAGHPRASALRHLLESEAAGGVILMGVAALALLIANSPFGYFYFAALHVYVGPLSLLHWINDGLMAVFFLLVGLEIKRELVDGQLATWPRRVLPGIAAAGGMIVPAVIFLAFTAHEPALRPGWGIPTATDIAFALGVLALLGSAAPVSLKIFLTAVAIIDDLGAVAIIAAFYTAELHLEWLAAALATVGLLCALNRTGIERLAPYLALGVVLWFFVLRSGVHATLAGVALAFTIPVRRSPGRPDDPASPLHRLEHALDPWVAYLVVPVFGFANAGVSLIGMSATALLHPVTLGIAAGLFLGKQIGVFLAIWSVVKLRLAERPEHASWPQVYGVSILCGIGFTMSLFIGLLAFPHAADLVDAVKLGVLAGSLASAVVGIAVLKLAAGRKTGVASDRR